MISQDVKNICRLIGEFYLDKHCQNLDAAIANIDAVGFSKIEIVDTVCEYCKQPHKQINITVRRVDIFIGRKDENINALEKVLPYKIHIIEEKENINDFIYPEE